MPGNYLRTQYIEWAETDLIDLFIRQMMAEKTTETRNDVFTDIYESGRLLLYHKMCLKVQYAQFVICEFRIRCTSDRISKIDNVRIRAHPRGNPFPWFGALIKVSAREKVFSSQAPASLFRDPPCLSNDNLLIMLIDFFFAETTTTTSMLDCIFLLMIKYQDVQEKLHKEIDSVIGWLSNLQGKPKV